MPITNSESNTRIDEIAEGIFRISTPLPPNPVLPAGFTFNQFLVVDDESLLFHTGPKGLFPLVKQAIATVLPPEQLRWISFSHVEGDESGSAVEWLEIAPNAQVACSQVAAMVWANDALSRPARALADGELMTLGTHTVRWFDAPHVPHGWDCGFMGDVTTKTLFCGDLFTQAGADHPAVTETEVLGPSEGMRGAMDYYAHSPATRRTLQRLAAFEPRLLACMHGASYRGNGAEQLLGLAMALEGTRASVESATLRRA
jgi:flavorubredoxin